MTTLFETGTCKKQISGLKLSLCTKHKGNLMDFVELFQHGSVECRIDYSWEEQGTKDQFFIDAIIPMNNIQFISGNGDYLLMVNRGEDLYYMHSRDGIEKLEEEVVKELKEEVDAI